MPGGLHPAQWIGIDRLSDQFADGTLKLTTRQAFQLHGEGQGKPQADNEGNQRYAFDTLAACGDGTEYESREPLESSLHGEALSLAKEIHDHLTPRTTAYAEICWMERKRQ